MRLVADVQKLTFRENGILRYCHFEKLLFWEVVISRSWLSAKLSFCDELSYWEVVISRSYHFKKLSFWDVVIPDNLAFTKLSFCDRLEFWEVGMLSINEKHFLFLCAKYNLSLHTSLNRLSSSQIPQHDVPIKHLENANTNFTTTNLDQNSFGKTNIYETNQFHEPGAPDSRLRGMARADGAGAGLQLSMDRY